MSQGGKKELQINPYYNQDSDLKLDAENLENDSLSQIRAISGNCSSTDLDNNDADSDDDIISSLEKADKSVDSFFAKHRVFDIIGLFICTIIINSSKSLPLRVEWFLFNLASIAPFFRNFRVSFNLFFATVLFMAVLDSLIFLTYFASGMKNILLVLSSGTIYSYHISSIRGFDFISFCLLVVFVVSDIYLKDAPSNTWEILSVIHSISYGIYLLIAEFVSVVVECQVELLAENESKDVDGFDYYDAHVEKASVSLGITDLNGDESSEKNVGSATLSRSSSTVESCVSRSSPTRVKADLKLQDLKSESELEPYFKSTITTLEAELANAQQAKRQKQQNQKKQRKKHSQSLNTLRSEHENLQKVIAKDALNDVKNRQRIVFLTNAIDNAQKTITELNEVLNDTKAEREELNLKYAEQERELVVLKEQMKRMEREALESKLEMEKSIEILKTQLSQYLANVSDEKAKLEKLKSEVLEARNITLPGIDKKVEVAKLRLAKANQDLAEDEKRRSIWIETANSELDEFENALSSAKLKNLELAKSVKREKEEREFLLSRFKQITVENRSTVSHKKNDDYFGSSLHRPSLPNVRSSPSSFGKTNEARRVSEGNIFGFQGPFSKPKSDSFDTSLSIDRSSPHFTSLMGGSSPYSTSKSNIFSSMRKFSESPVSEVNDGETHSRKSTVAGVIGQSPISRRNNAVSLDLDGSENKAKQNEPKRHSLQSFVGLSSSQDTKSRGGSFGRFDGFHPILSPASMGPENGFRSLAGDFSQDGKYGHTGYINNAVASALPLGLHIDDGLGDTQRFEKNYGMYFDEYLGEELKTHGDNILVSLGLHDENCD